MKTTICDSLIMRGMTVFARPAKIQAINGTSLQELQPDVIFPHDHSVRMHYH
jgi:glucitol operon activator protein